MTLINEEVAVSEVENLNPLEENEQIVQRKAKLAELRREGIAFPNDFRREDLAADLHQEYEHLSDESLNTIEKNVSLAGRMMTCRVMGKASFATLQDMSGKIQVYVMRDEVSEAIYTAFKNWDLGDILGVTGVLFKTKTGELTIRVKTIRLLTKALRPMPDKFHGLSDQEQRYRQRYLDLMVNEESRRVFKIRSQLVSVIKDPDTNFRV